MYIYVLYIIIHIETQNISCMCPATDKVTEWFTKVCFICVYENLIFVFFNSNAPTFSQKRQIIFHRQYVSLGNETIIRTDYIPKSVPYPGHAFQVCISRSTIICGGLLSSLALVYEIVFIPGSKDILKYAQNVPDSWLL